MVSLGEIAFWSVEGGDTLSCPEGNNMHDMSSIMVFSIIKAQACFNHSFHRHCRSVTACNFEQCMKVPEMFVVGETV